MEIIFSKTSKKQLERLNPRIQQKVLFTLEKFKANLPVDIIKLKNREEELRIRTGNYRIQLKKIDNNFLITKVGKRENFYMIFFGG